MEVGGLLLKLFLEWPLKGIYAIVDKISAQLDLELNEEEQIKKEMIKLNMLYEMDQIDEKEYTERQQSLLQRLEWLKQEDNEA
jgi:hypothetical protein